MEGGFLNFSLGEDWEVSLRVVYSTSGWRDRGQEPLNAKSKPVSAEKCSGGLLPVRAEKKEEAGKDDPTIYQTGEANGKK